jgi:transcriptional repressor NF-X1
MSKSQAQDIATRTHEDIANSLYECPICTSEVLRNSKIWSCKTCWTVFHLSCIKRWSKNEGSTQQRQQPENGDIPPPRQWRCPGCNLPKDDMPTSYTCWCAKEVDPKSIPGLPPHSCGQSCGKLRAPRKCPHPCDLICHAGPCPPCPHMGPETACFCGQEVARKRCIETDYDSGWGCGKVCGDLLPCGEHTCQRECHEGLCGSCEVLVDAKCYCGKVEKDLPCSDQDDLIESSSSESSGANEKIETWIGSFQCEDVCNRLFDCGKHSCKKECHAQTGGREHCPFSPDVVSRCPCGKTSLQDLECVRTSCDDNIPYCQETCQKPLVCGHLCVSKCHEGECSTCLQKIQIKCRCGRTSSTSICHQGTLEPPQCARTCKVLLNCGRHECGERCCPAEKIAGERQKRKQRSLAPDDIEAEHICTRTCGRVLKCGNQEHVCQELCHRGACGSCREAIFDEISCHCGRTVLHPPLACGTQPPPCTAQCNRQTSCGHPKIQHNCHMDDVSCPKCPYLTQKTCMCGKSVLKNQPCWSTQVSCGQVCKRRLKCG